MTEEDVATNADGETFGAVLREMLDHHRVRPIALARWSGCEQSSIARYLRGERHPEMRSARAIAEALSLTPAERVRLFAAAGYVEAIDPLCLRLAARLADGGLPAAKRARLTRSVEAALRAAGEVDR